MSGLFDLLFLALIVWWILRSIGQAMGGETGEGRPEGGFDLEDVLRGRTGPRTEGPSGPGVPERPERAGASRREGGDGGAKSGGERERLMASIRDELSKWSETRQEGDEADDRPDRVRRAEARLGARARERELTRAAEPELSAETAERSTIGGTLAEDEIGNRGFPAFGELSDREAALRRPPRPVRRKGTGAGGSIPDFTDRSSLERAILYREILGPPRALSPWRGTGYEDS